MDTYIKEQKSAYAEKDNTAEKNVGQESVLEKIASSYTKLPEQQTGEYNVDNCNCGKCFCLKPDIRAVLSPAGIAVSVSAFGPISASH